MWSSSYRFVEHWEIPGFSPDEVWCVVADPTTLPVWWDEVYERADLVFPPRGRPHVRAVAGGWLPYALQFNLTPSRLVPGRLMEVEACGDFQGTWRAEFSEISGGTRVDITWTVAVKKPLIRWMSWLLRPLFAWNHRWTTPIGEAGLIEFLQQRAAEQAA